MLLYLLSDSYMLQTRGEETVDYLNARGRKTREETPIPSEKMVVSAARHSD